MATSLKVLGQSKPLTTTLTALYTVTAPATSASVSTLVVCNQSPTATSFRVSIAPAGAADTSSQYIYYDVAIAGNDTFCATIGIGLAVTDVVRVYTTAATCSFALFGAEVS